jgi:hypothetical protein
MSLHTAVKEAEVSWMDRRLAVVRFFQWVEAEVPKACDARTDGDMKN